MRDFIVTLSVRAATTNKAELEASIVNALSLLETVHTIQDIEIQEAR